MRGSRRAKFRPASRSRTRSRVFCLTGKSEIAPELRRGKRVLIAAHGNSLRALVKHLDQISDADIVELNIPTGIPLVYELDEQLKPVSSRYLGDPDEARRRAEAVANQGKGRG